MNVLPGAELLPCAGHRSSHQLAMDDYQTVRYFDSNHLKTRFRRISIFGCYSYRKHCYDTFEELKKWVAKIGHQPTDSKMN